MRKALFVTLAATVALASPAAAQTLSRYAAPDSIFTFELNDLAGAERTASAFVRQVSNRNLLESLLGSEGVDAKASAAITAALQREVFFALSVDRRGNPHFLVAARVPANAQADFKRELDRNTANSRKANARIQNLVAGGLPFTTVTPRGDDPMSYGFYGGVAYAADSADVLGGFLRKVAGKESGGLATTRAYANAMNLAGSGNFRMYLDLKVAGSFIGNFLKDPEMQFEGINLAPIAAAVGSVGRLAVSMKVTPAGIETATVLNPDPTAGDAALARLLVPPRTALRAAEALPATAIGFTTSAWDAAATLNYLPNLLTRMGVENVQQTLNTELGFDLQRDVAAWMGNEIASATLPGDTLGESVYLIAVRNEAAAANGIAKVMPALKNGIGRLSDVLESEGMPTDQMGFELRGTTLAPSTFNVAGTTVTSYPVADGTAIYTAIKGGFLYIATSQATMTAALAGGPRLSTNANYRAVTARAAGATSYGFSDVGGTLKTAAPMMRDALEMAFSLSGDLPAREAQALQKQISGLIDLAAQRAGVQVSWTENTANGIRMRSFLPVKW